MKPKEETEIILKPTGYVLSPSDSIDLNDNYDSEANKLLDGPLRGLGPAGHELLLQQVCFFL